MIHISKHLNLPASKLYGVAAYNQFGFQPSGKRHFTACRGTTAILPLGHKLPDTTGPDILDRLGKAFAGSVDYHDPRVCLTGYSGDRHAPRGLRLSGKAIHARGTAGRLTLQRRARRSSQ